MSPKRERIEAEDRETGQQIPIYASEVPWLSFVANSSKCDVACGEMSDGETKAELIKQACKLIYILYHNIQEQALLSSILQFLNKSETETNADLTRAAKSAQSAWKAHIVNKFLLPHVKEIIRKWRVARPYAGFQSLPASDRAKVWFEAYDADPKGTVVAMWKPVIKVLDLESTFRTDLIAEDNAKMKAVRQMLRHKYYFGCECAYKYSVADEKKSKILEDWAAYVKFGDFASRIVPFANLPISSEALALGSADRPLKKMIKHEAMGKEDFECLSAGSTLDPSSGATTASVTSDQTASDRQILGGSYDTPNSWSASRIPSVAAPSAASESHEWVTETSGFSHDPLDPSSYATIAMSEEARSIREFFGIKDDGLFASAVHSEAVSSAAVRKPVVDEELL
ncbi:uncharacterized protein N0V89_008352 [Didymosphaeria variabile]|uniref:Uncharacterized protein n=1 Tax=Didymosphaeria variabile TaxID=1932322 RepID=A0A9W8XFK7_9PLEO|nr:uncharacterized protein N0V89_008352 [Didymosphaeria variabile]KAJ4349734.1 hypothetical protein N0V89_008352 [Didymosphaeria variabile]